MNKQKSIGYCRVSTDEQAREGVSLLAQQEKIKAYALIKDLELIEIVSDAGLSAKDLNRKGLQKALCMLQTGEANHLIVYKLDRLTRSTKDLLSLVYEKFIPHNISLHSITETLDTTSANGRFFLTMLGAMATWERETIRERTRDALSHKRQQGQWSGRIPYGFRIDEIGCLVEDQQQFKQIQRVKRLRRDGLSIREISRRVDLSIATIHKLISTNLRTLKNQYSTT
ncbi:MAG: recombinase family protein [Verrucomicrobiota bacterium]